MDGGRLYPRCGEPMIGRKAAKEEARLDAASSYVKIPPFDSPVAKTAVGSKQMAASSCARRRRTKSTESLHVVHQHESAQPPVHDCV